MGMIKRVRKIGLLTIVLALFGGCEDRPNESPGNGAPVTLSGDSNDFQKLPNVSTLEPARVLANQSIPVHLQFPKGWKLNDRAPSWMAVFDGEAEVVRFSRDDLQKEVALPPFQAGKLVQLRGSFYYCEATKPQVCIIKSVQQSLTGTPEQGVKVLEIQL